MNKQGSRRIDYLFVHLNKYDRCKSEAGYDILAEDRASRESSCWVRPREHSRRFILWRVYGL